VLKHAKFKLTIHAINQVISSVASLVMLVTRCLAPTHVSVNPMEGSGRNLWVFEIEKTDPRKKRRGGIPLVTKQKVMYLYCLLAIL
jgi:hypothetical protein